MMMTAQKPVPSSAGGAIRSSDPYIVEAVWRNSVRRQRRSGMIDFIHHTRSWISCAGNGAAVASYHGTG